MYKARYDSSASEGSDSENPSCNTIGILDFSSSHLTSDGFTQYIQNVIENTKRRFELIDTLILAHNLLDSITIDVTKFNNLKTLDLSNNQIIFLPESVLQLPLHSLIVKNNRLSNNGLPKCFEKLINLKVCNLSGNQLTEFPKQVLVSTSLEYLYLGNNKIMEIPGEIQALKKLKVLCLGGNFLTEIPATVGELSNLQGLILSDNLLETLPSSIANLKNLRSLLLHKNRLRTLPTEIIALKCLSELSLRENPLVVSFVSDMLHNPPSLLELAGRTIKLYNIEIPDGNLPVTLRHYLKSAHRCVNPKCKGVFFDNRVEHIKFVDFCGKYRLPLLQYLCSSKCIVNNSALQESYTDNVMMRKVLLEMMWSFFSRDSSKDFSYEIGELISPASEESIWNLHTAKKKSTGEVVSIFEFVAQNSTNGKVEVAKSAVKRLKSLRHPSILTYINSLETDKAVLLATEYVEPLSVHLQTFTKDNHEKDLYLSWGIFQITRVLSFLNNDGHLRHNNVCMSSVFVSRAGEWKLGNVEHMAGLAEGDGVPIKILPALEKYSPPEKSELIKQRHITKCSTDMWGLGCLIWEVYNGASFQSSALRNAHKIPKSILSVYGELIASSPSSRPNPADVITRCRKNDGFFKNDLVDTLLFLEEIQIKDKNEKNKFFNSLTMLLEYFPNNICKYKILPHLINAYEYGEVGSAVLIPLLKLGNLLDDGEYQKKIVPCIVKLFNSNDRVTRSKLLQQMEHYIGRTQSTIINDQIFPQLVNGFLDTNPMIREQTIKSVIHLSPKLTYNNLNVEIMRHFARLQSKDDQSGIRTNTTVCLGKIARHLHPQIRQKVLISAFIRAMRDPFPPARVAGVLALAATQQYFLTSEVASRILPALCQLAVDPDKTVRDHVFRTIRGFLGKLEKLSEDPTLRESMEADVHASTPSLSNAAATWAGWAVSAVTAKFYRSQSDTTRPTAPRICRGIHKPSSLEQPLSSSSISTNTTSSEVTSMASFEQEDKALDSVSDYDENWENDNWSDIRGDIQTDITPENMAEEFKTNTTDGWDDEDWSPIETVPEKRNERTNVEPSGWDRTEWNTVIDENQESQTESMPNEVEIRKMLSRKKEVELKKSNKRTGMLKLGAKKL